MARAFSGQTPPPCSQHENSQAVNTELNVTPPEAHPESPRQPATGVTSESHVPADGWFSRQSRTCRRSPPNGSVNERSLRNPSEIGRASCRERGEISVGDV